MNSVEWLTPREAGERANHSRDHVRRALTCDELHGHRRGVRGHWRVHIDALTAWITAPDEITAGRASYRACPCSNVIPLRRGA